MTERPREDSTKQKGEGMVKNSLARQEKKRSSHFHERGGKSGKGRGKGAHSGSELIPKGG